jgi:hypothetical protein
MVERVRLLEEWKVEERGTVGMEMRAERPRKNQGMLTSTPDEIN